MPKQLTISKLSLTALFLLVCPILLWAQSRPNTPAQAPDPSNLGESMSFAKAMQSDMELLMKLEMELTSSPAKELPFSAQVSVETEQTLADGTHITRKTSGSLYRDGLGRVRQELTLPLPGGVPASADIARMVLISDPSAGAHWTLMPAAKMAMKMSMPTSSKARTAVDSKGEKYFSLFGETGEGGNSEALGTQNMEGVAATGTRITQVIPAGQLGNDQPLQIVTERWYSAEMQMPVLLKRSDPTTGSKTLKVMDIQRGEPDAALFSVPADYAIKEIVIPWDLQPKKPSEP